MDIQGKLYHDRKKEQWVIKVEIPGWLTDEILETLPKPVVEFRAFVVMRGNPDALHDLRTAPHELELTLWNKP